MTTTTKPWYDTKGGFEQALGKGLAGLHEIQKERSQARKEEQRMETWIVLGYFYFDSFGQVMVITEGRPDYHTFNKQLPRVLTEAELKTGKQHGFRTMTFGSIPPADEVCPRCLEGWTTLNVTNYKAIHDNKTESWTHWHKKCRDLMITQSEIAFFTEILEDSGIVYTEMRLIPAEYPDRPTAPWFMVETTLGPIKIGYRRRVISISWKHAEGLKEVDGNELFKEEPVTKDRALIHAWGKEKAVEYLQRLVV